MIALDTTAIIDLLRGDSRIKKVLSTLNRPVVLTQLSYIELMFGLDREKKQHREEEEVIDRLFTDLSVLPITQQATKTASKLHNHLKKKGTTIGQYDCLLAGILLSQGITRIVTNDKQFSRVNGLTALNY